MNKNFETLNTFKIITYNGQKRKQLRKGFVKCIDFFYKSDYLLKRRNKSDKCCRQIPLVPHVQVYTSAQMLRPAWSAACITGLLLLPRNTVINTSITGKMYYSILVPIKSYTFFRIQEKRIPLTLARKNSVDLPELVQS